MSAIPSGAVAITFAADHSDVDKYLAEIRQGYTIPIRPVFQGGSGGQAGPAASSSAYVAPRAAYMGGPTSGGGGSLQQLYAGAQGVNAVGGAAGGGATHVTNNVTNHITNNVSGGVSPGGGAGPGLGGGGGRGGMSTRGLARYATIGFAIREGLSVASDYQQYQRETTLAYNDPRKILSAEMAYREKLTSIPIAGQIAGFLDDPSGEKQTAIARMQQEESTSDDLQEIRARRARVENQLMGRAYVAEGIGLTEKRRRETENRYNETERQVREVRDAETAKTRDQFRGPVDDVNAKYDEQLRGLYQRAASPQEQYAGEATIQRARQQALAAVATQQTGALNQVQGRYNANVGTAARERDAVLRDIHESLTDKVGGYFVEGARAATSARAMRMGGSIYDAERAARGAETDYEGSKIGRDYGPANERAYRDMRDRLGDLDDTIHRREIASTNLSLRTDAATAAMRGNRDPLGAQLTGYAGEFAERFIAHPENRAASWADFKAQSMAAFQEAKRDAGFRTAGLANEATVIAAQLGYRGTDAKLAEIEGQRQQQLHGLPDGGLSGMLFAPVRAGINYVAGQRSNLVRRDDANSLQYRQFELGAENRQLGIATDRNSDPATRQLRGEVDAIRSRTQLAALADFENPLSHGSMVKGLYQHGGLELTQLQQNYMAGFQAQEVSANRTALSGPGTEDPSQALKGLAAAAGEMNKKIPPDLATLLGQIIGLGTAQ